MLFRSRYPSQWIKWYILVHYGSRNNIWVGWKSRTSRVYLLSPWTDYLNRLMILLTVTDLQSGEKALMSATVISLFLTITDYESADCKIFNDVSYIELRK